MRSAQTHGADVCFPLLVIPHILFAFLNIADGFYDDDLMELCYKPKMYLRDS